MARYNILELPGLKRAPGTAERRARGFILLAATFIVLLLLDLAASWAALEVVNGARAYAVGEGRYSVAQKRAVLALDRFINSRSRDDYDAFLEATAVPRGDRDARVALQTWPFDRVAATAGFLQGQNHAADVDSMIRLFRYLAWWTPFAQAIADWTDGDRLVDLLVQAGGDIAAETAPDPASRAADQVRISRIDAQLTERENMFATHMGEAARSAKHLVVAGLGIATALLWTIGISFSGHLFRRQLELDRQLAISERRFRDYAEAASDWYWEVDHHRRITFISELYYTLTGARPGTVLGRDATEFLRMYAADAESWNNLVPFISQQAIKSVRLRYPREDGTVIYLSVSARPCFDDDGVFLGYRGVGSDVTAAFEAAQALRDAKERAEIANRAKSEFLANMSHELRTPLNAIIGFSEIIMYRVFGSANPERYDSYARDINGSGRHLLAIIDEILDLSKIEAGREELDESEVDLNVLMSSTERLFGSRCKEAGLALRCRMTEPPVKVFADSTKLKQCLSNLLSNAVKFTPAGGEIDVSVCLDDRGGPGIAVRDTGIGIAAADLPTVMSAFGQVESAFQRAHSGTGLGLPLTKALIELHGGAIKIDSREGVGTTVTLTLPAQRVLSVQHSLYRDGLGAA